MTGSYLDYLIRFEPKPIRSEAEYDRIQTVVDDLLDASNLSEDEALFLDLLGTLIERYEAETFPDLELRGIPLIRALLEEQNLKQKVLTPIFKAESTVSAVLNGHRRLTADQIDGLAQFFNLPHALFFENTVNSNATLYYSQQQASALTLHESDQTDPNDRGL